MKKGIGLFVTVLTLILTIILSVFTVSAAGTNYYIEELKMSMDLPEDMIAVTRKSPETDKYYSLFGIDYQTAQAEYEQENIYLRAMNQDSSKVLTVTMLSDDQSQRIGDYNKLTDDQLVDVENVLLQQPSYTSCTIERYDNSIYMNLQYTTEVNGNTVYATQYNTVVDGNYINIILVPANGSPLTANDYQMLTQIISSVTFADKSANFFTAILENPIFLTIGIVVVVVLVFVIITVIYRKGKNRRKKAKKAEKKEKNQELIQELAQEFALNNNDTQETPEYSQYKPPVKEEVYTEVTTNGDETAEDILEQIRREKAKSEEERFALPKQEIPQPKPVDVDNIKVYVGDEVPVENYFEDEPAQTYPVIKEEKAVLHLVTDDENQQEETEQAEKEQKNYEVYELYSKENNQNEYEEDEDEEDEEDEEVIGSDESFDQSDDYFDEGLDQEIYSRETIDDEDNYEEERKAPINGDGAKEKAKTAGAVVLNGLLIFLNGVKSFFIHLGYFFTNLTRMIKRAYKKHKFKKAQQQKRREQEEARRRRQENLRRKQQRQREMEQNGLVKVHSRQQSPYSQNRRPRQ